MKRLFNKCCSIFVAAAVVLSVVAVPSDIGAMKAYAQENAETAVTYSVTSEIQRGLGSIYDVGPSISFFGLNSNTEFDSCYRNQLDTQSQAVYDKLYEFYGSGTSAESVSLGISGTFEDITVNGNQLTEESSARIKEWAGNIITPAFLALIYDHPELSWLCNVEYDYSMPSISVSGSTATVGDVKFSLSTVATDTGDISDINTAVAPAKSAINADISNSIVRYNIVKGIHDYLCENIEYNDTAADDDQTKYTEPQLRCYQTAYSAFYTCNGDSEILTVCAGYAKGFKVLCDSYNIPCVYVTGDAGTDSQGAHAWNYVQMDDGKWYAIDATWDDRGETDGVNDTRDDYFLSGSDTVGFDSTTFTQSHTPSGNWTTNELNTMLFFYPELETSAYVYSSKTDIATTTVTVSEHAYNESEQSPTIIVKNGDTTLVQDTDYTVTGITSATDGGTYTVTLTGIGNYSGTKTVEWTIEKVTPQFGYTKSTPTYNGTAQQLLTVNLLSAGCVVEYSFDRTNWSTDIPTKTDAGTYKVYYRIIGTNNYSDYSGNNFYVSIAKAIPEEPAVPTATAISYGEKLSASTLSDSSWAWVDGTIVPNANAYYNAYIEVDDSNYDYTGVDGYDDVNHRVVKGVDVIITRATLTITANSYTIKVGDTLPTYAYDVTGLVNNDTLPFDVSLSCSATDSNTVGTYPITISGVASDALASLYAPIYENGTLTISEKDNQEIAADDVTLTYGETKNIGATTNGNGTISYSTTSDVISVAADGTITAHKAGTATVTITAAETADYAEATKTISVTVNKKKVAVPTADTAEYTYTGTAQTYGVTSTDDYTVEGGVQTNAGEYPITITLNNENYEWDGTLGTYKFVINKAAVTVTAKSYSIKVGETLPTYAYDVAGLVNGETLPIDVTISCTADSNTAGTYTITVSGAANSTNYTFAYANGTLTISNKLVQTITASDVTMSYGETGKKITATTSGDGAISYSTTSDVISVAADGTITALKAGTATVTINVAETDTYAAATKTVTVTVNKAAVTVTAKSYSIKVGETLPTYAYDVAGLVNSETLPIDVTISCNVADSNTAGTYDIIVSGAAASDNYTFSYVNGTLTVSEKEVVAAPTFTPASGTTFTSTQNVIIACATEGATIYYTTDGSTPTTANTKYTGAITITSTTTIKAIAVKDGMGDSTVSSVTYTKQGSGGYIPTPTPTPIPTPTPTPTTPVDNEPQIKGHNGKTGWNVIKDEIKDADAGDTIVIDMNGTTKLPKDITSEIKGKDIDIVLDMGNGITWTINGLDVTNPKNVDMGVKKGTKNIPVDVINSITGESYTIQLSLEHNGDFGFTAVLTVDLGKKNNGLYANLFWYYEKGDELVIVDFDEIQNGKAELMFTHASDWAVVIDDEVLGTFDDVSSDAGIEDNSEIFNFDSKNGSAPIVVAVSFATLAAISTAVVVYRKRRQK